MPRNIVICCDGTNNEFGICNTNVVRLTQVAIQDPDSQLVYYDPGVGTLPEPGALTRTAKQLSKWKALAFGTDIEDKVCTAYAHLMELWAPGDRVFVFGFSRGAYTARVLAGFLHAMGLLPPGNQHLLPYAMRIFSSLRRDPKNFWKLSEDFRWTFARPIEGDDSRRFPTHFVGLWDTVSSVGWVWNPTHYQFTYRNPSVKTIRHAVSLDERRCFFRQNLIGDVDGQDAKENWFPGVHSDVGGGYTEDDGQLWRVTFEWMISEAQKSGLLIDANRLDVVLRKKPRGADASTKPSKEWRAEVWNDKAHESLRTWWWIAEVFPKLVYDPATKGSRMRLGLGKERILPKGAALNRAVVERLKSGTYKPRSIAEPFRSQIKSLKPTPESVTYEGGK